MHYWFMHIFPKAFPVVKITVGIFARSFFNVMEEIVKE